MQCHELLVKIDGLERKLEEKHRECMEKEREVSPQPATRAHDPPDAPPAHQNRVRVSPRTCGAHSKHQTGMAALCGLLRLGQEARSTMR